MTEIVRALIVVRMARDDPADTLNFGAALAGAAEQWREAFRREMIAKALASAAGAGGDVLTHLKVDSVPQTALTQRTGLSKQAVQQLLDQLETASLVRRETDQNDKRIKHVMLTEQGRRVLSERQKVEAQLEEALRDKLGKKQFKKLRSVLREIAAG